MSIIKNIKEKDERLDKIIKQILNIKDDNISFSKDAVSKKKIHGRMANVFTGVLTYKIDCCPLCGFKNIIRHAYKDSWIQ
ncbi:ISL3 family transposase, partial [Enterococcus italicus]